MYKIESGHEQSFEKLCEQIMHEGEAAGMAVAVVNKQGQTVYQRFFGLRDCQNKLPVDENTIFGLASVSKSFTALAAQQLSEQGLIDLYAPVRNYVPELRYPDITMRHLLSHSAGFLPMNRVTIYDLAKQTGHTQQKDGDFSFNLPFTIAARNELIADMNAQRAFTGKVGENFSYSNHSFSLAGDVVRMFGGYATFAEYVRERIFKPLGMDRSGANMMWDDDNVAVLYQKKDGKMEATTDFLENSSTLLGGGGLKSTLSDMKKYMYMYLNRGKAQNGARLLSAHGVNEIFTPRIASGLNEYYCSGLTRMTLDDICVIRHGGGMVGVSSNMALSLECGLGVMVLCNTSGVGVAKVADAAIRLVRGLDPAPAAAEKKPYDWSEEQMLGVCGKYRSVESGEIEITQANGKLLVKMSGEELAAYPINEYMIWVKRQTGGASVRVYFDECGKAWALSSGLRMIARVQ